MTEALATPPPPDWDLPPRGTPTPPPPDPRRNQRGGHTLALAAHGAG